MALSSLALKEIQALLDKHEVSEFLIFYTDKRDDTMNTAFRCVEREAEQNMYSYAMAVGTRIIGIENARIVIENSGTLPMGPEIYIPNSEN